MRPLELRIVIEWDKFQLGASMFIPCLNRRAMQKFIEKETQRLKMTIICKRVIENGLYGLRVWRVEDTIET